MIRPLWRCAKCVRDFANRNQSHACGRYGLARHFKNKPPTIRALFDQFVAAVRELGPVRILPEKTRIAFQVRMSLPRLRLDKGGSTGTWCWPGRSGMRVFEKWKRSRREIMSTISV